MDVNNVGQTIIRLPSKLKEYAQPRPETQGDLEASSAVNAVLGGAIEGFIAGGPITAVAGGLGGYAGVKVGESRGSFLAAIGTGTAAGVAISTLAAAGLSAALGVPITTSTMISSAVLGGLSGVAGTLSGSRRTSTRDGAYGGYLTGMLAGAATGNPAMMIAGAAAGGIGGKAVKPLGRAILGGFAGAVTGALTGVFGGPMGIAMGAITGTVVGAVGATIGPPMRQIIRNATEDIADAATKKLTPHLAGKLGTKGKVALGAFAGALGLAPIGLIFGPLVGGLLNGLAIMAGAGAAMGGISTFRYLRNVRQQENNQAETPQVQGWNRPTQPEPPKPEAQKEPPTT